MNEQRNEKMAYLIQKTHSLQTDWYDLLMRLQSLENTSRCMFRSDLTIQIMRQIDVLKKNNPNKKIYRSISNFADNISAELNKTVRER